MCRLFYVSGRVQGVFFRASTARTARDLGVVGYARNLPDGRVEVLACGPRAALATLERWLWKGPAASRVINVEASDTAMSAPDDFSTA